MRTFSDVQNNLHTLMLTTQNAYYVNPPTSRPPTYVPITSPVGSLNGTALPYGTTVTNGRIYFSNGSKRVLYTNGESSLKDANTGTVASRYMTINDSHLILGYTTEPEPGVTGSREFRQRVRWSKKGDPNTWTGFSTGFEDLLDVPDIITGLMTTGRNTLVFRSTGITVMTPTGVGTAPFSFEILSNAPLGIGNRYPYSLAVYDDFGVFVADDDIYMINSGLQKQPIGGKAKKKIFQQLRDNTGDVVMGFPVAKLGPGVEYLSYWLVIPGPDTTWVWQANENNWQQFSSNQGYPTFVGPAVVG